MADAKGTAARVRADSDRELAAASQRRDAINQQLANVRQMLSALTGAVPAAALEVRRDRRGARGATRWTEPTAEDSPAEAEAEAEEQPQDEAEEAAHPLSLGATSPGPA